MTLNNECHHCEDTGYVFDTFDPCLNCSKGLGILYEEDKKTIKKLYKIIKKIKERIKAYEERP